MGNSFELPMQGGVFMFLHQLEFDNLNVKAQIPGFYYDSVKKRYFRLLPGHNNFNPLTRESIEKKEAEKKRLELLNDDQAIGQKKVCV